VNRELVAVVLGEWVVLVSDIAKTMKSNMGFKEDVGERVWDVSS